VIDVLIKVTPNTHKLIWLIEISNLDDFGIRVPARFQILDYKGMD